MGFIKKDKDNMLTSQANIFLQFFWFLELGDFRQTTTKKPKTPKKCFETEFLVSRTFFWGSLEFFVFFWFPRKGVCFFGFGCWKTKKHRVFFGFWNWFWKLASSRNQKNLEFFWFFSIQNQKNKHPFDETKRNQKKLDGHQKTKTFPWNQEFCFKKWFFVFWFLEFATSGNQKNQTPFRRNQKKPKKLEGNQKNKTFPWNQELCFKRLFFGFWFLGGRLSEVTQLQKPNKLKEHVGLGSQQAPETNKTYRKNSCLWCHCAVYGTYLQETLGEATMRG